MPGYFYFVLITGLIVVLMLAAPRRPRVLGNLTYLIAPAYNELPFVFVYLVVLSTVLAYFDGTLATPQGWVSLAGAVIVTVGLGAIAWRGGKARQVVARALDQGLGAGWRDRVEPERLANLDGGARWAKILFAPVVVRGRDIEAVRNIRYGEAGRANTLDLYRHRDRPNRAPVLIYFHGGGYYSGNKGRESRELLFRLARHGWVTISANYRLRPRATFFDHLTDVKRVVAWVHRQGAAYGADAKTLVLAGGSAGGHLSTIAALTQNQPRFQAGFEDADTSVSAVVSLYGWYGGYYGMGGADSAVGPLGYDAGKAPPFFIGHGQHDTLATVETARRFVDHLRAGSPSPVVYAEVPGGHHGFDLFYSLRYEAVVDGVEAFTAWLTSGKVDPRTNHRGSQGAVVQDEHDHEKKRRGDFEREPYGNGTGVTQSATAIRQ